MYSPISPMDKRVAMVYTYGIPVLYVIKTPPTNDMVGGRSFTVCRVASHHVHSIAHPERF